MSLKILLIEPPFFRFKGANSEIFPVGLGYIASILDKNGHFARVYCAEIFSKNERSTISTISGFLESHSKYIDALNDDNNLVWKEVKEYLIKYSPDVVGIAASTTKVKSALKVAEIAKRINPEVKVVIGGLHATIKPFELMENNFVDFVVIGEGELAFQELINAIDKKENLQKFKEIQGIMFRDSNNIIIRTKERSLADVLDFPFPRRELLIDEQKDSTKYNIMMCSRGCPYSCTFCNSPTIWGRKVRYHPTDLIVKEINKIWREEKTRVSLFDDTFTLNKEWVISLCKALIESKVGAEWTCLTRADRLDEEMLIWMQKAGCKYMSIGVEPGSQRVLDAMKKGITIEQVHTAEKLLKKHKMEWGAFIVIGLPYETKEDMLKTLDLIRKLQCTDIIMSVFTPYPGTEAFEEVKRMGIILEKMDWENFSHQSPDNYFCPQVPLEDFRAIVKEAFKITDRKNTKLSVMIKKAYDKKFDIMKNPSRFFKKIVSVARVYV